MLVRAHHIKKYKTWNGTGKQKRLRQYLKTKYDQDKPIRRHQKAHADNGRNDRFFSVKP